MGLFSEDEVPAIQIAKQWRPAPPRGQPYSVALPGSKKEGRSPVYRHWRGQDKLVETLDPDCKTCHDGFEKAGRWASPDEPEYATLPLHEPLLISHP